MNRLKKGDDVVVITGKDKGRRGAISKVLDNGKVLVEGVNLVKKHQKGNPNLGKEGGIVSQEAPLDASNVLHFNPESGKGEKIGVKTLEDGRKVRFFKSNNEVLDK
ncbi:MAG: 50S ribosomal protein L24 [bacterium]